VTVLIVVLVLVLVGLIVLVVGAPLRRAGVGGQSAGADGTHAAARADGERLRRDELEAARETKYREIRDTEMDFRTGKLAQDDYAVLDAGLRAEALAILDALQELDGAEQQPGER
jgi:hypothetical protein